MRLPPGMEIIETAPGVRLRFTKEDAEKWRRDHGQAEEADKVPAKAPIVSTRTVVRTRKASTKK